MIPIVAPQYCWHYFFLSDHEAHCFMTWLGTNIVWISFYPRIQYLVIDVDCRYYTIWWFSVLLRTIFVSPCSLWLGWVRSSGHPCCLLCHHTHVPGWAGLGCSLTWAGRAGRQLVGDSSWGSAQQRTARTPESHPEWVDTRQEAAVNKSGE